MKNKTLAIIPARGNSKRLKFKNLKEFCGKPLLAWSIELALSTPEIDKIIVSSEDRSILNYATQYEDCDVRSRPSTLSLDKVSAFAVIKHVLKNTKNYSNVLLLQPTSPLRIKKDLVDALNILDEKTPAVMSVCKVLHGSSLATMNYPGKNFKPINYNDDNIYIPNGAVYAAKSKWILENDSFYKEDVVTFEMPHERSIDIDYEYQFVMAEAIYNHTKS